MPPPPMTEIQTETPGVWIAMSLNDKANFLATQLGMDPALPISQKIEQALTQLGIKKAGSLVDQADECIAQLGGMGGSTPVPLLMGQVVEAVPIAPVQPMMPAVAGQAMVPHAAMMQGMVAQQPNRLKLVLQDGRGIALEPGTVDATHGRRAHFMRLVSAAEAIEVEFDDRGCVKVVAGHPLLGQHFLDNWRGRPAAGNRQHFSTWGQTHWAHASQQWELNLTDGTISPKNAPQLCLGWRDHSLLVPRTDSLALRFQLPLGTQISNSNNRPPPAPGASLGGGKRTDGLISTDEIAGTWMCMCFPVGFTACFTKTATSPDSLKHAGLLIFPFPIPFEEHRTRVPGTNVFINEDPNNRDQYTGSGCVCNGLACSAKLC